MANWASNLSVENYECPRCHAKKGVKCVTPSGRKKQGLCAHGERMQLLTAAEWDSCRVPAYSLRDVIQKIVG